METVERFEIAPRDRPGDGNIIRHYSIEEADWIWLEESQGEAFQAEFRLDVELAEPKTTVIHVSADQRYELFWNDRLVGRGPDRSDLRHWAFASYELSLAAGRHSFRALVTYLGKKAPVAQESYAPGFIFAADGLEDLLNTGSGEWQGRALGGIGFHPYKGEHYHVIGPGFSIDGKVYFEDRRFAPVVKVREVKSNPHGIVTPGPVLHPTRLPDQKKSRYHAPGHVLSAVETAEDQPWEACSPGTLGEWAGLADGREVAVAPHSEWRCLLDLGNYFCGYTELEVAGGTGSQVKIEWAESLYSSTHSRSDEKGDRDEWEGKYFHGFGDRFYPDGPDRVFRSLWWRSGRYVQVCLKTGEQPLVIKRLQIEETGYPADFTANFDCSDPSMKRLVAMMERGLECCGHEIMVDCPYYEQLSYVGDTRLQALCWLVLGRDDRLVKRELELFDWSRHLTGYVAERYPSFPYQLSLTFSMIWILMLGDFSKWRNDPEFMRIRLPGMRSLLDLLLQLRNEDGLLERLPGWSFVDWIDGWESGNSPGSRDGSSAVVDLLLLLSLRTARAIEDVHGEPELAARWERLADEQANAIRSGYWDSTLELFTDLPGDSSRLSLHAQCLAILGGLLSSKDGQALLTRGMQTEGIAWPSPYFQYYLFDALSVTGMGGQILKEMNLWRGFLKKGLKTPPEKDDPTRSDCHAWGSHPLFHLYASIAGIRPAGPGMSRVRIEPAPGDLEFLKATLPVEGGQIVLDLRFSDGSVDGTISLPAGIEGDFFWGSQSLALISGQETDVSLSG